MQTTTIQSLQNSSRAYPGCRMTFRLTGQETNGALTVIDMMLKPGAEPPRHIHEFEDETFIVHSGELNLFVGEESYHARKGDVVFIPRTTPHHFRVMSEMVSCTILITPGGLEDFFEQATFPCLTEEIPVAEQPPTQAEMDKMNELAGNYGIRFV